MFLWEKHVSNGGFSKSCLMIGGSVAIDLELLGSKHSFLSGWSAQRPMLQAWNHRGLEKGKTLAQQQHPELLHALTKLVNLGYPNHQIGPGLCCLAFPHHDFWGLPRHFVGGSETSDTSLRAPVRAPGGPADVRVVVLPLGTSAQNALGPLSWGACPLGIDGANGRDGTRGGPKFPRKSYAWIISMTEADSKLCLSRIVL